MKYVFYVDVFFFINLLMDFYLLKLVGKINRVKANSKWLLLSASIGGLFSILIITLPVTYTFFKKALTYLVCPMVMCVIAFHPKKIVDVFRYTVFIFLALCMISGLMDFIYYKLFAFNKSISFIRFLILGYVIYHICDYMILFISNRKIKEIYEVELGLSGKSIRVNALYDTGNSLKDPYLKRAVHIVELEAYKKLIEGDEEKIKQGLLIPYHSIGKDSGLIRAVVIDYLRIKDEKDLLLDKPLIAIYEGKLSGNNKYNMILNKEVNRME